MTQRQITAQYTVKEGQQVVFVDQYGRPVQLVERHGVVYSERRPKPRPPWPLICFLPFLLGSISVVALVFVVDDITWLVKRLAALLVILFMAGTVGSVIAGIWYSIRDTFTRDSWRDYL